MGKKSCKKGYYYCFTDKKCKRIPKGWHVMSSTGRLMRDSEHQDENENEGKKKNGNGNGANGNGNGNGESNGGSNGGGVSESKDHEVAMAQSQLKKSARNIAKLRKALGKKEKDIPAWMQAKITDTAHDTDAAAGYVDKMDEEFIAEKRDGKSAKSKGYSLRDWFKGGGWVQAGGKYDGKPCARQPGQKTKPFCRDADDRANMSKKERNRRAAKKRREDPNPNRKGKAKMVTASYSNWRADLEQLDEGAAQAIRLGLAAGTAIGGAILGKKAHDAIKGMQDRRNKKMDDAIKKARGVFNSYVPEGEVVEGYDEIRPYDRIRRLDGKVRSDNDIKREKNKKANPTVQLDKAHFEPQGDMVDEEGRSVFSTPGLDRKKKVQDYLKNTDKVLRPQKPTVELDKAHYEPEGDMVDEGKKDACYHKVKSRYSVWPSAYASGALVKCRKVGAKNWGNKTKKESYEFSNWRDDFQALEYESVDIIKAEPLQPTDGIGSRMLGEEVTKKDRLKEIAKQLKKASAMHAKQSKAVSKCADELDEAKKCWKGYKKVGTQKLFGKTYNRCEKIKKEEVEIQEAIPGYEKYNAAVAAAKKLTGRKKIDALKAAAELRPKTEKEVDQKIPESHELGEDWQKSNRNDGVDGMSQKSVDAYKRENPGSKLQTAVTGKNPKGKDKKRRKSFCARSKGQKDMHNIDCTKTPDKKICKARKRWRC